MPDTPPVIAGRPLADTVQPPPPRGISPSFLPPSAASPTLSSSRQPGPGLKLIPGRAPCGVASTRLAAAAQHPTDFPSPKTFLWLVEGRNGPHGSRGSPAGCRSANGAARNSQGNPANRKHQPKGGRCGTSLKKRKESRGRRQRHDRRPRWKHKREGTPSIAPACGPVS